MSAICLETLCHVGHISHKSITKLHKFQFVIPADLLGEFKGK